MNDFNMPPGVSANSIPGNAKAKRVTVSNTSIDTWFERDRACVILRDSNDVELLEFWDEDVAELVEDGFLDPRDWHGSAVEYFNSINS